MNQMSYRRISICTLILIFVLFSAALAGCGEVEEEPVISDIDLQEELPEQVSEPEDIESDDKDITDDDLITVGSVEELIEAIGPYTTIQMEPGYYNLSEYLGSVWDQEGEQWNQEHTYVQIRECFDGVELLIRDVIALTICGDEENLTELVTDPRYAAVMNFEECTSITLSDLTMGHTENGDCTGNVLNFSDTQCITLTDMDLYGCGVYGISSKGGSGELFVYDSVIRDCTLGPLEIYDGNGQFAFYDCALIGSGAGAYCESSPYLMLSFYNCIFGDNETSYFMFQDDIYTENCTWSDNFIYPEYGYAESDQILFTPDAVIPATVGQVFLYDSHWVGYALANPESGETFMLPYEETDGTMISVEMHLFWDGTGWLEHGDAFYNLTWTTEDDTELWITLENGQTYCPSFYTMAEDSDGCIWMLMDLGDYFVWLC